MIVRFFIVFYLSISSVFATETTLTAQQWLEKMSQSMKNLNYQGTIAFVKNGRLDTMKYFHQINNGQEKERLLSLNTPIRDVIRENGKVLCFYKSIQTTIINHRPSSESFILNLPASFSALNNDYHIIVEKEAVVATRSVHVISIKAKDNYRYNRKIWIDNQHFLPLKMEIYDVSDELLEQVMFTEIQVGQEIPLIFTGSDIEKIKTKHIHKAKSFSADETGIVLDNIPSGFKITSFSRMNMGQSDHLVDHLLLSDGFSSISVYRDITTNSDQKSQQQAFGIINSITHFVKNHQITVMGEVPAKTVQFVVQGVHARSH